MIIAIYTILGATSLFLAYAVSKLLGIFLSVILCILFPSLLLFVLIGGGLYIYRRRIMKKAVVHVRRIKS